MTIEHQQQPYRFDENHPRGASPLPPPIAAPPEHTAPLPPTPPTLPLDEEPAILGFPAEFATGADAECVIDTSAVQVSDGWGDPSGLTGEARHITAGQQRFAGGGPGSAVQLMSRRRADWPAGLALVLAGVAAVVSLWLPWYRGVDGTGLPVVRQGVVVLGSGVGALGRSGLWPPLVVVLGGGVLLLLGLLLFRRARTHRLVGVLALLVAMAADAGVVVPLANANWSAALFGPGMWCAVAVAGLGTLGAIKAMLTMPLVRAGPC
jgi:hypothetical protein